MLRVSTATNKLVFFQKKIHVDSITDLGSFNRSNSKSLQSSVKSLFVSTNIFKLKLSACSAQEGITMCVTFLEEVRGQRSVTTGSGVDRDFVSWRFEPGHFSGAA